MNEIKKELTATFTQIIQDYGFVICTLVVGIIIGWYIKVLITDRKYNKLIQKTLKEKDDQIIFLKDIVHSRLKSIVVETKDKGFFNKVKNFFKSKVK